MDSFFNKMNKLNEQVKQKINEQDVTGQMSQLRRRISSGGDMMDEAGVSQQSPYNSNTGGPTQQPLPSAGAGTRPLAGGAGLPATAQTTTSTYYSTTTRPTAGGTQQQQQHSTVTSQIGSSTMATGGGGGYGPSALTGGSDYSSSTQQRQSPAAYGQQKALTSAPTSPSKSSSNSNTFAPAANFARSFFTAARQGSIQGGGGLTSAITGAISKGIDAASSAIEQAATAAQQSSVGQQLAGAGAGVVGSGGQYAQSNVKILLVIDDMSTDWSKYFRKTSGRSALPGGEQIRVEQAEFAQLRVTVFQDKRGALVDILETSSTNNTASSGGAPVARTVRPDFVFVRQMARDGERQDYRHILQALLIAGVPSVINSLDACIEQQERSLTLARLRRLAMPHPMSSKHVVPNALPLIPHIFMPSLDQMRSGGTGAMAAASSFQYPFVVKIDHARRGAAKVLVRTHHELSELGTLAYSIARSNGSGAPYVTIEPYIGDAKYDMLLQRIGPNVERAFIRKAVAAASTIATDSSRRGSQTAGGYSTTTAAAQNPYTNNMVDHHWKANQGGSLLEAIDVEDTHRAWLTAVTNMYTPPLDVVTIKCLVLANGSAVILGIQDSSMILLGETQEDDRRTFCEIAYEKMAQFVLRRRESSAVGPASGPTTAAIAPAPKLQPQQRQQSLAGRSDAAAPHPATVSSQTSVPNRAYGSGASSSADVVGAQQSTGRNMSGGGQASLSSFRRPSQDQGMGNSTATATPSLPTAGGASWQQQQPYGAETSGGGVSSSRNSGISDYSSGSIGTYGSSNTQRTTYGTDGSSLRSASQTQDSGIGLGGYGAGGGGGGSSYSSGMGSLSSSSSTGTTINSGMQQQQRGSTSNSAGGQTLPQFNSSAGGAGTLPSSSMYAQQYSGGSGSTGSASSSRSSGTISDTGGGGGGYNSTTTVQYGGGGYGSSQPPDNNDLTPRSSFGSSASSAVATNSSDNGLRDDPYGNNNTNNMMAQSQQQYGGVQQYGAGSTYGRGAGMQPPVGATGGGSGGVGSNGEPDTMQNLKKTFQGIFGDIS